MPEVSNYTHGSAGAKFSGHIIDKCAIVPILGCVFALIVSPLILFVSIPAQTLATLMEGRWENRIFWPAAFVASLVLAATNYARLGRLTWPPHILWLFAYLAFAGASVLWAFKPDISFERYVQQVMIVTSVVLPTMLAAQTTDMVRNLFFCFAIASLLNIFFVAGGSPEFAGYQSGMVNIGYPGYFGGKNYLGECAALALLLSIYQMLYPGPRRAMGIIVAIIAILLIFWANSKTALGLALLVPVLAWLTLFIRKMTRISPAVLLWSIPICYIVLSTAFHYPLTERIAYTLTGDSSFTGREIIWWFAGAEIDRRPLLGWGYQSFWLVGPDAPSLLEAPGWVKNMPNAHNGYYDTMLELGYLGLALLLTFITATLHAIGRIADRDPRRACGILSVVLYIILFNFLESLWMRGFEFLWVVFLILAAEIGRYSQPVPSTRMAHGSIIPRQGDPAPSLIGLKPRPRIPI